MIELTEQPDVPSALERLSFYSQEIGLLNVVLIIATLAASLTIALKAKAEDKETDFRRICIIGFLTLGWLFFDLGRDLVSAFNYSTTDGKMPLELVLTDVGKRAFQIQAISLHTFATGVFLLIVHLKKPKV